MRLRRQKKLNKKAGLKSKLHPVIELLGIVADRKKFHGDRGDAARHLHSVGDKRGINFLLQEFFSLEEKTDLYTAALALEESEDIAAVGPLIRALHDKNPHRRHAAARALGWIRQAKRRAGRALTAMLADHTQPQAAREEAAESLAYLDYAPSVPVLAKVVTESDPRMRFWACFGLGSIRVERCQKEIEATLLSLLNDEGEMPTFYSVRLEALMLLADHFNYKERLLQEIERIDHDPSASESDRRWAEWYRPQN
ncbi:MAG: HEAT repeat domain-containing protein [Acidobacteria bacterium]|nr:HEAT repeat domain-containing protein [Acidobacteriota bacterium]